MDKLKGKTGEDSVIIFLGGGDVVDKQKGKIGEDSVIIFIGGGPVEDVVDKLKGKIGEDSVIIFLGGRECGGQTEGEDRGVFSDNLLRG